MSPRKALTISLLSLISIPMFAQNATPTDYSSTYEYIKKTEFLLDQEIGRLNNRLSLHSRLLPTKMKVLPQDTVIWKGKNNNGTCVLTNGPQEVATNDCIHLEVYDFIESENGKKNKGLGPKYKFMELFFDPKDPANPDSVAKLKEIKTRMVTNHLIQGELVLSEVVDKDPTNTAEVNNQMILFYQWNGFPSIEQEETPGEKGVGRVTLATVENTQTNPIRNEFKQKVYIKQLDYFDKLFNKIYSYNYQDSNTRIKTNIRAMQQSLKY